VNGAGAAQALKLTAWLGERDRAGAGLLADTLVDLAAAHRVEASCLLRGAEGFGTQHRLRTQRLLTLSEDLPLAVVAVGAPERIGPLLDALRPLHRAGLLTLERVQLVSDELPDPPPPAPPPAGEEAKLTLHLGRRERADGRPAHLAAVDALHAAGVAGATVLLGVDGTVGGARQRARFLSRNDDVPLLVVSVGERARIADALPRLRALLARPLATFEHVHVCKRDGALLRRPPAVAPSEADADGCETWQQLTVYGSEQSRHGGETLHTAIVRRLRAEGAAGATALRGIWGYHGDHAPHGDRFRSLRRRVPVVTVVVDAPERAARWFDAIDELTDATGLVTSELVRRVLPATGR
jgi:PII-like signaling protein